MQPQRFLRVLHLPVQHLNFLMSKIYAEKLKREMYYIFTQQP